MSKKLKKNYMHSHYINYYILIDKNKITHNTTTKYLFKNNNFVIN
jgi:hypothetical protein